MSVWGDIRKRADGKSQRKEDQDIYKRMFDNVVTLQDRSYKKMFQGSWPLKYPPVME